MICNKNNNGGGLAKMGYNPNQRRMFFYLICIWVRLFLAYLVFRNYNNKYLYYIIPIIAVYSLYLNVKKDNKKNCVWWNRQFHIVISLIILIVSLFKMELARLHPNKLIAYLLGIDVLFGVVTSFIKQPWN
jgi:hypothetical protein